MDLGETSGMSKQAFSISYASSERPDDHSIDVNDLAPALLAFGQLINAASSTLNNKATRTKLNVVSDFEHRCFNKSGRDMAYRLRRRWLGSVRTNSRSRVTNTVRSR